MPETKGKSTFQEKFAGRITVVKKDGSTGRVNSTTTTPGSRPAPRSGQGSAPVSPRSRGTSRYGSAGLDERTQKEDFFAYNRPASYTAPTRPQKLPPLPESDPGFASDGDADERSYANVASRRPPPLETMPRSGPGPSPFSNNGPAARPMFSPQARSGANAPTPKKPTAADLRQLLEEAPVDPPPKPPFQPPPQFQPYAGGMAPQYAMPPGAQPVIMGGYPGYPQQHSSGGGMGFAPHPGFTPPGFPMRSPPPQGFRTQPQQQQPPPGTLGYFAPPDHEGLSPGRYHALAPLPGPPRHPVPAQGGPSSKRAPSPRGPSPRGYSGGGGRSGYTPRSIPDSPSQQYQQPPRKTPSSSGGGGGSYSALTQARLKKHEKGDSAHGLKSPTAASVRSGSQRGGAGAVMKNLEDMTEEEKLIYSKVPRQVDYKPYTKEDYEKIKPSKYYELGTLGPDLNNEELLKKKEKMERMKAFGKNVTAFNNATLPASGPPPKKKQTQQEIEIEEKKAAKQKAMEFASRIPKPKTKPRGGSDDGDGVSVGVGDDESIMPPEEYMTRLELLELKHQQNRDAVEAIRREFG